MSAVALQHAERADSVAVSQVQPMVQRRAFSIFHEPWWLDIASEGRWRQAEVHEAGRLVGSMPFLVQTRLGVRASVMPCLTRTLGPVIVPGGGKHATELRRRLDITEQLIARLPRVSYFRQTFDPRIEDDIAFQLNGFHGGVEYTFGLDREKTGDVVWSGMLDKTRNLIRKAGPQFTVDRMDDPERFRRFYEEGLAAKKRGNMYQPAIMSRLLREVLERRAGMLLGAWSPAGVLTAAVAFVWDEQTSYYLLTSRRPDAHSGAVSLLLWHGIQDALKRNLSFDFDGVPNPAILRFLTGFGGRLMLRHTVESARMQFRVRRFVMNGVERLRLVSRTG